VLLASSYYGLDGQVMLPPDPVLWWEE
jgi:alpha-glucosidase